MKTVFEKEQKIWKYYIQEFASRFRVSCQILNYVSESYPPKVFDSLEKAKAYGESYFEYLDSVADEF